MEIRFKIRKKREEKGYSQDYMAIQLGITQKTYWRLENGQSKIDLERLQNISKILEIDPLKLISFDEKNTLNNNDQKRGNAANIFIHAYSEKERHLYESLVNEKDARIKHLEEENKFLRELLRKEN